MHRLSSRTNQAKTVLRSFKLSKNAQIGSIRQMSDNLLGHSPMAGTTPANKNLRGDKGKKPDGPKIGVDSNTEGGGVWAQTSAKRDKLGELKLELKWDQGQRTLDEAASDEEKFDLFLLDGVNAVVMLVDGKEVKNAVFEGTSASLNSVKLPALKDFYLLLEEFERSLSVGSGTDDLQIDQQQFESHVSNLMVHVDQIRNHHAAAPQLSTEESSNDELAPSESTATDEHKQSPLMNIRDIMPFVLPNENKKDSDSTKIPSHLDKDLFNPVSGTVEECTEYFRILLLQSCLQHLSTKWDEIIKISDADLDRAATTGDTLSPPSTISLQKIHQVLDAFTQGTCQDRVKALWDFTDKDQDGLIDQVEMDEVIYMSIAPVEDALKAFVQDCLEVWPVRGGLPMNGTQGEMLVKQKKGRYKLWKEARADKKANKIILKLMDRAIKKHFEIDVEVPHRLRCCYAWAEKQHQSGKVENVLVDSNGGEATIHEDAASSSASGGGFLSGGRKRYVELDPKISYQEFRDVQKEHFSHLDRVAEELCTSFKEELWIHQGTGRQNTELKRESAAFLAVVSLIDFGIYLA
jgi:hypothetical protein